MITLYGTLRSRATRIVWTAEELGIPYRREKVVFAGSLADPLAADAPLNTASRAFLRVNPMGQLPAMVDDGLCMGESQAICYYMARKAGGPLGPASLIEEGDILKWMFLAATTVESAAGEILYTYMDGKADQPEGQTRIGAAITKLARPFGLMNTHLATTDWLVGGRFTVADIALAEIVRYATNAPGILDAYPSLKAWYERCQARPAFQRMWAMREAE